MIQYNSLLDLLEAFRMQIGMSVDELCEGIISKKTYFRYLKNGIGVNAYHYYKLASKLGLDYSQIIQQAFFLKKETRNLYSFFRNIHMFDIKGMKKKYQELKNYNAINYKTSNYIKAYLKKYEYIAGTITKNEYSDYLIELLNNYCVNEKSDDEHIKDKLLSIFSFLSIAALYYQVNKKTIIILNSVQINYKDLASALLNYDFLEHNFLYFFVLEDFITAELRAKFLSFDEEKKLIECFIDVTSEYDSKNINMVRNMFRAYLAINEKDEEKYTKYMIAFYNALNLLVDDWRYNYLLSVVYDIFGYLSISQIKEKTSELVKELFIIKYI